ncbi:sigma-B regulation protein RsbU (phosphoserine phosphatase) [Filimonas lacunae]|uniref:Sigma-B regulation protein RsbU (Phosphoserine phosphatase) n=1 Tax=Filimonas lacunae TaxID=477680 RepID=A0A173MS24_9BACT|nr:fused response regulator/phosphatase [Filimonas lacunae]BAV10239.1 response regulator [Filimonas lacunae]SIT17929.1 sigma-B regulation protein RsbU (phosphoserine phosphatase) [Filimonas lacunae]
MASVPVKKILIVEDNELFLKLLDKHFSRAGYDCMLANSPSAALHLLEHQVPELILSDYEMPGMNGFDFRQQLLTNKRYSHIPFVFLTAHSSDGMVMEGLGMQAVDFIDKQTPFPVLTSKIDNIIHTVHKTQELNTEELKKAAHALNIKSVPAAPPQLKGFYTNFWHQPFQNYPGGDFIDFIGINERYTFLVLGDVMGKKWQAWFFSFGFLSYVRSAIRICIMDQVFSPARILEKINNVICYDEVLHDVLSSLSLLMIDNENGSIKYAGAGDLPLLHYHHASQKADQVSSSGLLPGLMKDGRYEEQLIELQPNDILLIFSDGMTDFRDAQGKHSNYNAFVELITPTLARENSFLFMKTAFAKRFTEEAQVDDCSLIFIQKK